MASASWRSAVQIGSTDETFSRWVAMTILCGELLPRKSVEFQNAPGDLSVAPFFLKFRGLHPLRWALPPRFPSPAKGTYVPRQEAWRFQPSGAESAGSAAQPPFRFGQGHEGARPFQKAAG